PRSRCNTSSEASTPPRSMAPSAFSAVRPFGSGGSGRAVALTSSPCGASMVVWTGTDLTPLQARCGRRTRQPFPPGKGRPCGIPGKGAVPRLRDAARSQPEPFTVVAPSLGGKGLPCTTPECSHHVGLGPLLDLDQLHVEDQRGVGRDRTARGAAYAVAEVGRHGEPALSARPHPRHAFVPPLDHPA